MCQHLAILYALIDRYLSSRSLVIVLYECLSYFKKRTAETHENESWEFETLNRKPTLHESVTRHHFPVPGPSSDSSALTGDRVRERGAGNRADAPIHLIKRSQELGAGKYALFT